MSRPRVILLVTSPRLPAGLLTAAAWDVVRAHPVLAATESELTAAVRAAGAEVSVIDDPSAEATSASAEATGTERAVVARLLTVATARGAVVWLAGPAGDEQLARELGLRLAREPALAELELMYGSWDPPGARLLDAVAVMDKLASPGGDPWKRAQTHASLARYLLEECYEAYDAIDAGDLAALREELGDVLLQVVLHARLAQEHPEDQRWNIDDVAGGLVEKMIRRNPHVFAGESARTLEEITAAWERVKREEKPRESVLDGVPLAQPALALAAKLFQRAERAGLNLPPTVPGLAGPMLGELSAADDGAALGGAGGQDQARLDEATLGAALLALVARARAAGLDAEAALRRAALDYAEAVRAAERTKHSRS